MENQKVSLRDKFDQGLDYPTYFSLIKELAAEGKNTGPVQSPELLEYSTLNIHRMERVQKTVILNPDYESRLLHLKGQYQWLVITEGWCGDASQIIPVLAKMADAAPGIELRMVFRDENPDLMEQYLTEGKKSIPILIVIDPASDQEIGIWGPRPKPAQEIVIESKSHPEITHEEMVKHLQLWYSRDRGHVIEEELITLIESWGKKFA